VLDAALPQDRVRELLRTAALAALRA
jgi:hypothetical protein